MRPDIANVKWCDADQIYVRIYLADPRLGHHRVELWRITEASRELVTWDIGAAETARARALTMYREALEVLRLQIRGEATGQLELEVVAREVSPVVAGD